MQEENPLEEVVEPDNDLKNMLVELSLIHI
jgi:hypothetical protein